MTARSAGFLLHPTSLPGRFGIGDLGPSAWAFLRWAQAAGQSLWQVLPLGPTGPGDSPYGGLSAFAGNPMLISPERLVEENLLPEGALASAPSFPEDRLDSEAVRHFKDPLLRQSWQTFLQSGPADIRAEHEAFCSSSPEVAWLDDWALFAAISSRENWAGWVAWPEGLARRRPESLDAARRELAPEIAYEKYLQFLFFRQWSALHAEGKRRGIGVLGDVPIYVSHGSADVWVHPEIFTLDESGMPELVAGVPPDYFSPTGQLWGYPLYRWDRMEERGFDWWVARFAANLRLADLVRVDHFRAFAAYWAVPANEETALHGRWMPGPGLRFFDAVRAALGGLPLVAEDLGTITPDVRELLEALGIPGMKVLQFAFSDDDHPYQPHRHVPNAVVYTGTHDNDTTRGWYRSLSGDARRRIFEYLGTSGLSIEWDLIRAAYESVAERAVVPAQDVFELGPEARMNNPAPSAGNWLWRARAEEFRPDRAARLRRLAELTGRLPARNS